MSDDQITDRVRQHYSAASQGNNAAYSRSIATAFGYTEEDLAGAPKEANLGLSCGNPLAIAKLREGEVVIDLGSGAGFDVFQVSNKVGSTGQVIGVDSNKDMLARANKIKADQGKENVQFIESDITAIALPAGTADCIISNCVINLVPDSQKQLVFNEIFRLLKPGGRVAVSDILAKKTLPESLRNDMALYVGCIAGASQVDEYRKYLSNAGFRDSLISDTHSNLNAYLESGDGAQSSCCSPPSSGNIPEIQKKVAKGSLDFNEWAGSYKVYAVKPASDAT